LGAPPPTVGARIDRRSCCRRTTLGSLKSCAGKGWFTFLRIDGRQAPAFDSIWKLADIEYVK
jgi:hypothetical protein